MSATSRQSVQTLAGDISAVLSDLSIAEAQRDTAQALADGRVSEIAALTDALALANGAIAALNAGNADLLDEIERLNAELALYRPRFLWGDATRQQFLGAPFTESFPFCYESEFYPGSERGQVSFDFVLNYTMPAWRTKYPYSRHWAADIEWQFSGGVTAAEVAQILPAFQAARAFGRDLRIGAYNIPKRIGVDSTPTEIELMRPVLDLLDEAILPLYALYSDVEKGRRYVRQNIAMARAAMPGKPVYVVGWPAWHPNAVTATSGIVAGDPISVEWWRMLLEESQAADGFAIWLKASAPQPTGEPWWLETLAWMAA